MDPKTDYYEYIQSKEGISGTIVCSYLLITIILMCFYCFLTGKYDTMSAKIKIIILWIIFICFTVAIINKQSKKNQEEIPLISGISLSGIGLGIGLMFL